MRKLNQGRVAVSTPARGRSPPPAGCRPRAEIEAAIAAKRAQGYEGKSTALTDAELAMVERHWQMLPLTTVLADAIDSWLTTLE